MTAITATRSRGREWKVGGRMWQGQRQRPRENGHKNGYNNGKMK